MAEWGGIHFMGMYGCIYLFFPLSHSCSAAFDDTAVRPAAELPMGLIYFAEIIVSYGSFPIFRTLPHPKAPLASPHLSGAHGWRERGARARGSPSAGQPVHEGRCSRGF